MVEEAEKGEIVRKLRRKISARDLNFVKEFRNLTVEVPGKVEIVKFIANQLRVPPYCPQTME